MYVGYKDEYMFLYGKEENIVSIGSRLRIIRHALNLSAKDVGNSMFVTRQTINNIERGDSSKAKENYYRIWLIDYIEKNMDDFNNKDIVDYQRIIEDLKKIKP